MAAARQANPETKVRQTTSVKMTPDLQQRLKIAAATEGRTMSALLEDAVEAYLKKPSRRASVAER
jgi:predicted DNA-binding protein